MKHPKKEKKEKKEKMHRPCETGVVNLWIEPGATPYEYDIDYLLKNSYIIKVRMLPWCYQIQLKKDSE